MARQNNNEVNITFKAFNQNFNSAIKEMDDQTKQLRQEMKLQQEQMKHTATSTEKLEAKLNSLQQIYDVQRQKTLEAAQALQRAKQLWGENSQEVARMEAALRRHQIAEQQAANSITETQQALQRAQQAQSDQQQSLRDLNNLLQVSDRSLNDFTSLLGRDLVNAINSGRASSSQLERAFRQVARATQDSSTDIEQLRTILSRLNGSNIDEVRRDIEELSDSTDEATQGISGLEAALGALGGAVAGAGLKEVFESALNVSDLNNKIDIVFDVPEESKAKVRQALADVQKYGVDGEEALEGIRRQWALNKDASDEANSSIVEGAASIVKAYRGVDFVELVQETNEIAGELGIADEEALNLVNDLLKINFPTEQLDTIAEYGQQLKRAGYEASEIKGIMASAVATDSWNIDNLLDGLKEGRILAAEMGGGLSETFKSSIAAVTNNTKKMTDDQISALEDSLSNQEESLSKSLERRYKATEKAFSEQEDALKDSLDDQLKAVEKNYDRQERELDKALSAELKAYENAANQRIALIDKEYTERLKLIDEEKYNAIKAVDDEIKSIEDLMDADDRATEQAENSKKRAELQRNINASKSTLHRKAAEKELADFENELESKRVKEERKQNIESLKEQKDEIKDLYDGKKEEIKSEYDLAKEKAKESIDIERESIRERQQLEKESFRERKATYLENVRENHAAELESYREMNRAKLEQMKELQDEELAQAQKVNDAKVDAAKNPPDSALFKSTVSQLESWGKAVAAGGKEGTKAFEDMVRWLDGIEDATLRNTIGVQLFGTKWEDQGENIIDSILGAKEATAELEQTQKDVSENIEEINSENALVKFNEAVNNAKIALGPLLSVLADIIFKISTWAAENPKLTSTIFAIGSVIGILVGALAALAPIIFTVTSLFGAGSAGGGLLAILGKLGPFLTGLATKVLPILAKAFGLLSGPIGIIITILTIAVPLIIKNWDSIKDFFINLWKAIVDIFFGAINGISDFFKKWGPAILSILKLGPIGMLVGFFTDNWNSIWSITKTVFGKIKNSITDPIEKARDSIKNAIDRIKSFFNFEFEWPELKIPHLSIKKGSLNPLKWFSEGFPEIDIEWFAKGGIMTGPTVFGGSGNTAFVGGEAGDEAILPLNERVLGTIGRAIFAAAGGNEGTSVVHNYERMLEGATLIVREEADIKRIARELYNLQQVDRRGR